MKTQVRPVFLFNAKQVLNRDFCLLAYHADWHMREQLTPMLFNDEVIEEACSTRPSPVAKVKVQFKPKPRTIPSAPRIAYNVSHMDLNPKSKSITITRPTPIQANTFALLGVNSNRTQ